MTAVQVIAMRPVDTSGGGDVLRALAIVQALTTAGHTVTHVSVLGPGEGYARALAAPLPVVHLVRILLREGRRRPLQWILVQALAQARSIPLDGAGSVPIYVTCRVVPDMLPLLGAVDFVDALSRNAASRAQASRLLKRFWLREHRLLQSLEASIASRAVVTTAVSALDAGCISPSVQRVSIQADGPAQSTAAPRATAPSIAFTGNLYYPANREAAQWIMTALVPELLRRSWRPDQIVIAGRRPGRALRNLASRTGVTMLADVPDMGPVLRSVSVALAPMELGSGMQNKVVNALRVGTGVVMTPKANEGLGLQDSAMIRILDRDPARFADAIEALTRPPHVGEGEAPHDVAQLLAESERDAVVHRWLTVLEPILAGG